MVEKMKISGNWKEQVPVIVVEYEAGQMFLPKTSELLAEKLIAAYKDLRTERPSFVPRACVLWIKASTAGSSLVRAIFEFYKVLNADEAVLFCAEYPANYLESLTSLGLPALPGFKLTMTGDEAIKKAEAV